MIGQQGPLRAAKGFAVPLKMFAQHVHEGKPDLWTYLEDELFLETNPELRESIGQPVSFCMFVFGLASSCFFVNYGYI